MDAQGRTMRYLRLSVTDRCNFRCAYCSPASWGGKQDLLTAAELVRVSEIFAALGIVRVRLTGGEPTLRPDLCEMVEGIASVPGISRVALTTNASKMAELAAPLRRAGLGELNLSLDTLSPATFRRISKQGDFEAVLRGIDVCAKAGFDSVKVNVVVMRGVNDHEVLDLIRFAHQRDLTPRLIELMPFGSGTPVPTAELVTRLAAEGLPLEAEAALPVDAAGPATYFRAATGRVGFISPMTQNFCGGCNRVRVSANGELRACLGGREQAPLGKLLRSGAPDFILQEAIRAALGQKPEGHQFNQPDARASLLSMMGIGG